MKTDPAELPPEARQIISQLERAGRMANRKLGGWRAGKPDKPGLWLGAKWQYDGYYHVQIHPFNSSLDYLRAQNCEFWAGPFTRGQGRSRWLHHILPPVWKPVGVHKRSKGFKLPYRTVCVDRSTPWGNKFGWELRGKEWAVRQHRRWLHFKAQAGLRERIRRELRGKKLACWCRLDEPCHRNTLLEIANKSHPSHPSLLL